MPKRESLISRKTKETAIELNLVLDGEGKATTEIGIPFLEHMLTLFTCHGFFDLTIKAKGDLEVDGHHTVEDLGLCLGKAFRQALGEKEGIARYGSVLLPMDDALVLVAVDLSGRPWLALDFPLTVEKIGSFDTELVAEFLSALSSSGRFNLHVKKLAGHNNHHLAEALFKGLGRALSEACAMHPRVKGIPSTKEVLD